MNRKRFDYYHKDIKQLKKDIAARTFFAFAILAIVAWQAYTLTIGILNSNLSTAKTIIAGVVIFTGVFLFLTLLMYIFKDYRIIGSIKNAGKCTSSVNVLFSTKKSGFLKLYSFLMGLISLSTSLVLVAGVTYSILEASYFARVSFYMPMLTLMCFSSFSALYSIQDEVRTQKNVNEQNSY